VLDHLTGCFIHQQVGMSSKGTTPQTFFMDKLIITKSNILISNKLIYSGDNSCLKN